MLWFGPMVATAALLLSADVSGVIHLRLPANQRFEFPPSENLSVLPVMSPDLPSANDQDHSAQDKSSGTKADESKDEPLQPESRLEVVGFVDREFVRVVEPIPTRKK